MVNSLYLVNSKWLPKSKVKVTHLLDHVKNVTIRFAMVKNPCGKEISFLSVIEKAVLGLG